MVQGVQPGQAAGSVLDLNPENAEHGGGPPPDGNYLITGGKFELFDYVKADGTGALPIGARACVLSVSFTDDAGQVFEGQRYSVGNEQNYVPTADGEQVQLVGSRGLNDNSGCFHFLKGLVDAGFPADKISGPISGIVNWYGFCQGKKVERSIKDRNTGVTAASESNYLVPATTLNLPWEPSKRAAGVGVVAAAVAVGGTITAAPVGAPAPAAPVAAAAPVAPATATPDPADAAAREWLASTVQAGSLPSTIPQLATAAFQAFTGHPQSSGAVQLLARAEWLATTGVVAVDGQNITPA